MKVLLATTKPFAKIAVDGIRQVIEGAGFELALLEKYTELFDELPPTRINISLYGADNSAYQKLCGNEAFDKVMSSVKKMKELGIGKPFVKDRIPMYYPCPDRKERNIANEIFKT